MTRLLKVQDDIAMALVKAQVGQTVRVLVEAMAAMKAPSRAVSTTTLPSSSRLTPPHGQLCMVRLTAPVPPSCWVNFRNNIDILDTLS